MAEIKIKGNRQSFYSESSIEYLEIKFIGDFNINAKTPIIFFYDSREYSIANRQKLFSLSEKAKGASFQKLFEYFQEHNIDAKELTNNKTIENSLLKSILLIYHWIELPLAEPQEINIEKQIFNDFVLDLTNRPEPQKDIYFIKKDYCNPSKQHLIDKLIEINLLVRLDITITPTLKFTTYFIPLIKPGMSRNQFASIKDQNGVRTYELWQNILRDRDYRINSWIKNRF
jgi:hypothetical protein